MDQFHLNSLDAELDAKPNNNNEDGWGGGLLIWLQNKWVICILFPTCPLKLAKWYDKFSIWSRIRCTMNWTQLVQRLTITMINLQFSRDNDGDGTFLLGRAEVFLIKQLD